MLASLRSCPLGALLVVALLASACAGDNGHEVILDNVGGLCVHGQVGGAYVEDAAVSVEVLLEGCAQGCAENVMTSCTVEVDGNTLRVDASGSYMVPGGDANCPAICESVTAICSSTPLAAGTYTVEYAGDSADLVVPSMGEQVVVGGGCTT